MSNWDKPQVAEIIEGYWEATPIEVARRAWLAGVIEAKTSVGAFLEAGCGTGRIYTAICELAQVRSYTGVDSSTQMLAIAQQKYLDIDWRRGDLLDLQPNSADTVLCLEVLGHIRGDLVPELRALIGAARHTAVISLWLHDERGLEQLEDVNGAIFPRITRTHEEFLHSVHAADADCVVEGCGRFDEEMVCYIIRRYTE